MNVYRSSPPLPGIFRPSHLFPSAHAKLFPDSEDSSEIEGFSSDDEITDAEAGESPMDDDRAHSCWCFLTFTEQSASARKIPL